MFVALPLTLPFAKEIFDDEGENRKTVSVPIARCDETGRIVSVDCHLAETWLDGELFWEFSFEITVASLDGDDLPFSTQDRGIAAFYIPSEIRPLVMEIVCDACHALVNAVSPLQIYRVTKACFPPEKALKKHHLLTELIVACGYQVSEEGTDPWGRAFWVLERIR